MNPYSPISWLYVYGFLGQNSKNRILRLFLDIWKSGSLCGLQLRAVQEEEEVLAARQGLAK